MPDEKPAVEPISDDDLSIWRKRSQERPCHIPPPRLRQIIARLDLAEQRVKEQADEIERLRKAVIDLIAADAWPFDKMRAARKQAREILDGK